MADQKGFKKRLKVLMLRTENLTCADCGERQPRWASLIKPPPGSPNAMGMGALMCLECSGAHRRLGVHISFVRSVNLDSWKEHEVQIMENGGNAKVNAAYEAHLHRSGAMKVDNTSNGQQRERYIRDKYERRKFYDPAALQDYQGDESEEEEVKPVRRKAPSAATSRAPSEAARRRAESRQARAGGAPVAAERPTRISTPAPAPAVDLLDFGSMSSAPAPVAPAPVAPVPVPQANETLDLFANMTVASSAPAISAPVPPQKSTNDDILSLFSTPQNNMMPNNMMGGGQQPQAHQQPQAQMMMGGQQPQAHHGQQPQAQMMMGGQQPQAQMMMGGQQPQAQMMMGGQQPQAQMNQQQQMMMGGQQPQAQMNQQQQMMMQQQQMMMQQQMMQQQRMMQQQGQQQNNNMQGMPQQNNNNNMMRMNNNMGGQQMNQMMMQQQQQAQQQAQQQHNMHGMMTNGGMQQNGMHGMGMQQQNPMAQQASDGGFGAPMGSGPSISSIQGQPQKADPFADFGFNAFR